MSLVIANIPATFPSCKLGQNQMHCLDLHCPMGHASLIVSTAFARNREKTHPIFCCKEKPFPQNPQTQKRPVQVTGSLLWPCGESPCSGVTFNLCNYSQKPMASPHISAVQERVLCPPEPLCQQNWQREELPQGCSELPALTELTELERKVWHTLPSPGLSLCVKREFKHL